MNDIRFSGITRVELHAIEHDQVKKDRLEECFPLGAGPLKNLALETDSDVFVGQATHRKLYGDKLFIATGGGETPADTEIKNKLIELGIVNYTQDTDGKAGQISRNGDEVIIDTGTLDRGFHDEVYVFNLNGKYKRTEAR